MATISLAAEPRTASGSAAARRLRAQEQIPGVIYGHGTTPVPVSVNRRDLRLALSGPAGVNAVLQLTVAGKTQPTVVKELQRHKVRRTVSHIDFLVVSMDEEITVDVPIVLVGEAKAVLGEKGIIDPSSDTLAVITTPRNIPNEITIDVTEMVPGDVIRVGDISLPSGVTTNVDPDTPLVTTLMSRAAIEAEGAEAEGEGAEAEGEAGSGASAEGDASAE